MYNKSLHSNITYLEDKLYLIPEKKKSRTERDAQYTTSFILNGKDVHLGGSLQFASPIYHRSIKVFPYRTTILHEFL